MNMKIKYFLPLLIFLMVSAGLNAQTIMGGVGGGLNLAQVDGDYKYGFNKPGLNLGPFALVQFNRYFSVSIETVFNQKGAYGGPVYSRTDSLGNLLTGEYNLRLNYLEVPVLAYFTDKGKALFGAGFSYGRLVSVKEFEHGREVETTSLNGGPYAVNDVDFIGDIKVKAYENIWVSLRYNYSIAKIRTRTFDNFDGSSETRDQFNNMLSIRLIYLFKDKFIHYRNTQ